MQENSIQLLFQDLRELLTGTVQGYQKDHNDLLPEEKTSLEQLRSITSDTIGLTTITLATIETFISRIASAQPPECITKIYESGGFLGIGSKRHEQKIPIKLHFAIQRLLKNLENRCDVIKVAESKRMLLTPEKKPPESGLESIEKRLSKLETENKTAYTNGYVKGKKEGIQEGQQQLIAYFKENIGRYLEANQQKQALLLLEGKYPASPQPAPPLTVPNVFNNPPRKSDVPIVKNDEEKARKWIGEAKFAVVKQFVEFHNKNENTSEKVIAKWAIFELMLHRYDQSIASVLETIKGKLDRIGINITQLTINSIFDANNNNYDPATTQQLTTKEFTAFSQLTNEKSAAYLPVDNTAAGYFGSAALTAKEKLEENFIDTIKQMSENYTNHVTNKLKQPLPTPGNI